ncbi:MAG: Glucokinase [Firmicutes bacterium ADurb.Bin300]|nr:MAG: Glucokinase [Firmicutes bacterium ADurb.Bin300]HOD01735.1 ROK family protein [Clostridiales bacterium]
MYRVGVDLGGTNIAAGVVDDKLKIIGRGKVKTNIPRPAPEIFRDIKAAVDMAIEDAKINYDDVVSIGIGAPGSVNKATGVIEFANNLEFVNVPAKQLLDKLFHKPVFLDNDANCAALGEAVAGSGNGVKNFVAITLGTGVGSGIIIDGKLVNGVNFAAGEMGHMVICVNGEQCNCGRRGCWERYASATALVSQTKDAMHNNQDSIMWDLVDNNIDTVSGRTAFDAMRKGDLAAKQVVDKYIFYVASGIINIINALQPEIICVGGGIGHEKETILAPLRRHVERERYSIYAEKQTQLVSAALGNDAGIIGSALLDF